jgi:hypothetical protein
VTDLREVQPVTVPVPFSSYQELKGALSHDPLQQGPTVGMLIGAVPTVGRWVVIGLREDYSLGDRTYWVTLRWDPPRG